MREKKYIDRLYQEKFKDFEATPREAVWKSISEQLQEKERKKPVISPFWSRMAGAAAVISLILLIGDWIFPSQTPSVANEELEQNFLPAEDGLQFPILAVGPEKNSEEVSTPEISRTPSAEVTEQEITAVTISRNNFPATGTTVLPEGDLLVSKEEKIHLKETGKKSLFEAIAEKEEKITKLSQKGDFEVSTHAAPIYYGNFGKGNFINSTFEEGGEGDVTFSYGINVAYAVSDKIKIRSGVNMVAMSYNSSGIVYDPLVGSVAISGVEVLGSTSKKPQMVNDAVSGRILRPVSNSNRSTIGSISPGSMNQKMGFIEVPVELEYNLIDRKFELTIIGGASTLFLDENSISLETGDFSAVGKANNLNDVSFSTNIGLGVDYNLSDKFKLNVEPMLKYQLNTFESSTSENQPYYLGIYSGFSYKF